MAGSQTLNSRLRVLVARAYRAEKLYASMNSAVSSQAVSSRTGFAGTGFSGAGFSGTGPSRAGSSHARKTAFAKTSSSAQSSSSQSCSLAEAANEARAKEWQRAYYELRMALNHTLSLSGSTQQGRELYCVREKFLLVARESLDFIEHGVSSLPESAQRQEFTQIARLSLELIRHKARAQANRAVAEELSSVLTKSGRVADGEFVNRVLAERSSEDSFAREGVAEEIAEKIAVGERKLNSQAGGGVCAAAGSLPANVFQLEPRRVVGRRVAR